MGECLVNTDNFLIEENDIELAQTTCKLIENSDIRNRAVANVIAANIAEKFFDKEQYKIDTTSGLHNISNVLEKIDISDIYINNSYIETRIYFNDEELSIPKYNFDNKLLPVAYMFIKVTPDLSGASVVGFILPENIDLTNCNKDYYFVNENDLVSFYDIEPCMVNTEDTYSVEERQIFEYLDNQLEDNIQFYNALLKSESARLKLAQASKARYIFNFVSVADKNIENAAVSTAETSDDMTLQAFEDNGELELSEVFSESDGLLEEVDSLESSDFGLENALDSFEDIPADENISLEFSQDESIKPAIELQDDSIYDVLEEENTLDLFSADENESAVQEAEILDTLGFEETNFTEEIAELSESIIETAEETENEFSAVETIVDNSEEEDNEDDELTNSFDFSTMTSPSLDTIEENNTDIEDETIEDNSNDDLIRDLEANIVENDNENENNTASEEIENLFNPDMAENADGEVDELSEIAPSAKKSSSSLKLLLVLGLVVLIGAGGYLGYTKFTQNSVEEEAPAPIASKPTREETKTEPVQQDAMPIETVETTAPNKIENEGTAVAIPAIEQNLDASILVSNLKVFWEVPSGYASNTSAKRYFEKAGKIIQLNLKTELLLLNRPPITNTIAVEIKFNDGTKKFETVGVKTSSGEQSVDDLILQTINKALAMNLSVNTDSFGKLQGNPVLIIKL